MITLSVNGTDMRVDAPPETSLLWVLREHLGLTGTKFGCGAGQCGACTIHLDSFATFACQLTLQDIEGGAITTIEGLSPDGAHPLQRAWIDEQVPQCGYCQSGQIMQAAALLQHNPQPDRQEIIDAMAGNICRCGTYSRIIHAIERVAQEG
ncbi:(2Fe-2S)-binding protein [Brucella sp. BE17]|uniref:(2Fe-2S)-binding protein n=1 Tax=Brucella sp. BE17 TaxID=3142977 RepID=UPI0031BB98E1